MFIFKLSSHGVQHVDSYPTTVLYNGEEEEGERRRFQDGSVYEGARTAGK